jgi:DNA-binding NarL/FixJ family response regulator
VCPAKDADTGEDSRARELSMVRRSAGSNDKPRPPTRAGSTPGMCSVGEGKGFAVVTNEEMAVVLRQIGWSNAKLARRLDIEERTVREMLAGRTADTG